MARVTTTTGGGPGDGGPPPYPGGGGPGYPPPGPGYPPPGPGYPPPGQGYPPPGQGYGYGGGYGGGYGTGPPYASYWARAGGFVIDAVVVFVIDVIVGAIFRGAHVGTVHYHTSSGTAYISVVGYIVELIVWLAYGALLIGSRRGQTIGMMAVGARAVDRDTGTPIGYARALGRAAFEYVLAIVVFLPWVLDMLWPAWDARKQTLHDKVTRTVVVKAAMVPAPPAR